MVRNHSMSLLSRIALFMAAFMAAFVLQTGISHYQTTHVIEPIQKQTADIRIISQFLNDVEGCIQVLEDYHGSYGEYDATIASVKAYRQESGELIDQMEADAGQVSEAYYLLSSAARTTYGYFSGLVDDILTKLEYADEAGAANVYYGEGRLCGGYLRQYTQQLLEQAILDSQSMFNQLDSLNAMLRKLQTGIGLLCLVLGVGVISSSFTLLKLVKQMVRASDDIGRGCLDTPDVDESQRDELGNLARAFNQMKRSMKHQVQVLEEKNEMEQALLKKENEALELQNLMEREKLQQLRSQINPHFLFNTLNVILYTSRQEKAEKTQALTASLSKLFRYVLGSNEAQVPLLREIKIVDEFYTLCKARFSDRVELHWHIPADADVTEMLVPSFLIQPLVENAVKHGIGPKEEGGRVDITIAPKGDRLEITVADNGVGMSDAALETLRENLKNPPTTGDHIGVYNVAARLRLQGGGCGLDIYSKQGEGTRVLLRLPLVMEQEETDD